MPPTERRPRTSHAAASVNAAYLVDAERAEELAAWARRLEAEAPGARVEVTGPWASWSFVPPVGEEPA
jgi:Gas vesicle synthesis protein GvpL/GvpF